MAALKYIYLFAILAAFILSLASFRWDAKPHLKLFSILLGLTFLVELLSSGVIGPFHLKNYWIYNFFILVEFWAYAYYYFLIIRAGKMRQIITLFLILFPVFWLATDYFLFGFNKWNGYVLTTGSFFCIVFVAFYYYQLIRSRELLPLRRLPEFWIATGMLIFYTGALPYFGTLNYLVHENLDIARNLLYVIRLMDTLMYLLFGYGYLCMIRHSKKY